MPLQDRNAENYWKRSLEEDEKNALIEEGIVTCKMVELGRWILVHKF